MDNLSRLETLVNFGFQNDPFKASSIKTSDGERIQRILNMAVKSRAMVSIVGKRGDGKTKAITAALAKMNVTQVHIRSSDKPRILITDIEQAMLLDLGDEKPKRGREIRIRQLRRILGQASRKRKVTVVIEEAHRMHGMTLRALKTLRELDWMGETELFTVVLIGQSDPMAKSGVSEVRLRTDTVRMQGLLAEEIRDYIYSTVGRFFTEEAVSKVKEIPDARNFLNLQSILVALMGHALVNGRDHVIEEDVADLYGEASGTGVKVAPVAKPSSSKKGGNAVLEGLKDRKKKGSSKKQPVAAAV